MKTKSDLPADGVTVLSAVTLAGTRFLPGDHVDAEFWEKSVPEKNRVALLANGIVSTNPGDVSESECALHAQCRAALDEAVTAQKLLGQIRIDKAEAETAIKDLSREHRKNALADYKSTGGRGSTKTPALTQARDRLESLSCAETMALEEIERLGKEAEKLARQAELERARAIKEKRRLVCRELQGAIEKLVPLCGEYHAMAKQFRQLLKDTGSQITSTWRLENLIGDKLFGRAVPRDLRVSDLAGLDDRIFSDILNRAQNKVD